MRKVKFSYEGGTQDITEEYEAEFDGQLFTALDADLFSRVGSLIRRELQGSLSGVLVHVIEVSRTDTGVSAVFELEGERRELRSFERIYEVR